MKNLEAYIERKNQWSAIFNGPKLEWMTPTGRQRIADSLDADLSPENISCDGERPAAEVRRLYKFYTAAARELRDLDPYVKMYEVE